MTDPPSHPPEAAPRDEVRRAAALTHLTEFLGDDYTVLHERVSTGLHLEVLVFQPTDEVPYVTLVTAGMSDLAMNAPEGYPGDRLELMIGVPRGWPGIDPLDRAEMDEPANFWPIKLLKELAHIPSTHDSFLTWGHTILDEDNALFAPDSPYAGAIIGPPAGYPPPTMRAQTPAGPVEFLAVFPVTPEEMDYRIGVPGGGDALIDRLMEVGTLAVAERRRASVVAGPPPYSVHLLMTGNPRHLGDVLDQAVPHRAALFAQDRRVEGVVPAAGQESVRFRLFCGHLSSDALFDDAMGSTEREAVLPAVKNHRAVLTLTPERAGDGDPFMAVMAMAGMLLERDNVTAVWLPHQKHVATPEQFSKDLDGEAVVTYRVQPTELSEGQAVITRGFAALGGREVLFRDPDRTHERLTSRLQGALASTDDGGGRVPTAGDQLRYVGARYELAEAVHPVTGEPILELVKRAKKDGRGLFRRR